MASKEFQVTCIRKPDRQSPHEHITHIGNIQGKWMLTRESAISRIDRGEEAYYTVDTATGKRAYIAVVRETAKAPYLRSHADGKFNNNLLAQEHCSDACTLIS
jgi:hypothetical protein